MTHYMVGNGPPISDPPDRVLFTSFNKRNRFAKTIKMKNTLYMQMTHIYT